MPIMSCEPVGPIVEPALKSFPGVAKSEVRQSVTQTGRRKLAEIGPLIRSDANLETIVGPFGPP
jgi:hypothetical protein